MKRVDDRTEEQRKTHSWLVTGTDKFLSGWGKAKGGLSKCAWACKPEHVDRVEQWVRNRMDMKYVNVTSGKWYPQNALHVHIYVVKDTHPSVSDRRAIT